MAESPEPKTAVAITPPAEPFKEMLMKRREVFHALLPAHVTPEKFIHTCLTAVQFNPDLRDADKNSLLAACLHAANDGLLPDGREAALVVFNTKVMVKIPGKSAKEEKWFKQVAYMPMIKGVLKKVYQAVPGITVQVEVVYANDIYHREAGTDPKIVHTPDDFGDRGEAVGIYCIVRAPGTEAVVETMSKAMVERVKAVSKQSDKGPWKGFWEEMWKKTIIRRTLKRVPTNPEVERVLARDEALYDFGGRNRALLEGPAPESTTPALPSASLFADEAHDTEERPDEPDAPIDADFTVNAGDEDDEGIITSLENSFGPAIDEADLDDMIRTVQEGPHWDNLTLGARERILAAAETVRRQLAEEPVLMLALSSGRPPEIFETGAVWKAAAVEKLKTLSPEQVEAFWKANATHIEAAIGIDRQEAMAVLAVFAVKNIAGAAELIKANEKDA